MIIEYILLMKREYITEYYDYKEYEGDFNKIVNSDIDVNIKVGKLAYYMVSKFPKLPYFWGGGHNKLKEQLLGLDRYWGSLEVIKDYGSDNYLVGEYYPKSLDCSGFVTWCLVNAGYDLSKYISKPDLDYSLNSCDFLQIGEVFKINDEDIINIVKIGDLAYMEGHIGIICDVDYKEEVINVAHVSYSGGGSGLTKISLITSRVIYDSELQERVGTNYFTDIISVNY